MIIFRRNGFCIHVTDCEILARTDGATYVISKIDESTLGSDIQRNIYRWLCSDAGKTFLGGDDPYYYSTILCNLFTGISPISRRGFRNISFLMRYSFGSIIVDVRSTADIRNPQWVDSITLGHDMNLTIDDYWKILDRLMNVTYSWEI